MCLPKMGFGRVPFTEHCCCCCCFLSLKNGSLLIAWIGLIAGLLLVAFSATAILNTSGRLKIPIPTRLKPIVPYLSPTPGLPKKLFYAAMGVELGLALMWVLSTLFLLLGLFVDSLWKVGCGANGYLWYLVLWSLWHASYIIVKLFLQTNFGRIPLITNLVVLIAVATILSYMVIILYSYYQSLADDYYTTGSSISSNYYLQIGSIGYR